MAYSEKQSVIVVDDELNFQNSIKLLLASSGYRSICFTDPNAFLEMLPSLSPGCVLLDLLMPGMDGLDVLERSHPYLAEHPFIVMTGHGDVGTAVQTIKMGATDFIEKPFGRQELLATLEMAFQKLDLEHSIDELAAINTLTPRERDILQGLMNGLTNKGLANRYDLSPRTVEMHRANMMKRLGVRNLAEALRLGFKANIQKQ